MHPIMPFITEELYGRVAPEGSPLCAWAPWPAAAPETVDEEAERELGAAFELVRAVRNVRAEFNVPPASVVDIIVAAGAEADAAAAVEGLKPFFELARISSATAAGAGKRPAHAAAAVAGPLSVFVPLEGLIDFDLEVKRLTRAMDKAEREADALARKLADENFIQRAPAEVVAADAAKLDQLRAAARHLADNLEALT
jgi:valyl-tRNA synthetase